MQLLASRQGETDLVYRRGAFYLLATCNVDEPMPDVVDTALGVDLGVSNIATTSDGNMVSGSYIKNVRYRHRRLRTKLQKKGTKAARRRLKQLAGQERRFATDTNHVIAKRLVQQAKPGTLWVDTAGEPSLGTMLMPNMEQGVQNGTGGWGQAAFPGTRRRPGSRSAPWQSADAGAGFSLRRDSGPAAGRSAGYPGTSCPPRLLALYTVPKIRASLAAAVRLAVPDGRLPSAP